MSDRYFENMKGVAKIDNTNILNLVNAYTVDIDVTKKGIQRKLSVLNTRQLKLFILAVSKLQSRYLAIKKLEDQNKSNEITNGENKANDGNDIYTIELNYKEYYDVMYGKSKNHSLDEIKNEINVNMKNDINTIGRALEFVDENGDKEFVFPIESISFKESEKRIKIKFNKRLLEWFKNSSKNYSWVNSKEVSQLRNKNEFAIYFLMCRYYGIEKCMTINDFKEMTGSRTKEEYISNTTKSINNAVEKVNEITKSNIEVEYRRSGRNGRIIDNVKFKFRKS